MSLNLSCCLNASGLSRFIWFQSTNWKSLSPLLLVRAIGEVDTGELPHLSLLRRVRANLRYYSGTSGLLMPEKGRPKPNGTIESGLMLSLDASFVNAYQFN